MSGALLILPLYAFMMWAGTTLPLQLIDAREFNAHPMSGHSS